MSNYSFSLMDGEAMIFGVDELSSRDIGATGENKRRIGISNRRVMIDEEIPDRTIIVPNDEVVGVVLEKRNFLSETQMSLVSIEMRNGDRLELGLSFLAFEDEARLSELFFNARFTVV